MRAMVRKLLGVAFARDADHKSELPPGPCLDSSDGVLDDNRPRWLSSEKLRRCQERIRSRLSGQLLRIHHIAIDTYLKEIIQFGRLQNNRAIVTRGNDSDFEPVTIKLIDESDASFERLHPFLFDDRIDQVVLAIRGHLPFRA